jgi:hypothetical protein
VKLDSYTKDADTDKEQDKEQIQQISFSSSNLLKTSGRWLVSLQGGHATPYSVPEYAELVSS